MPTHPAFSSSLISWYTDNKRELPWRKTRNPYVIWVSEIILQQTRVQQGLSYFDRFIEKFPSVESLAEAKEDEVLKIWQGLGYYSRARNMHASAKQIMTEFEGRFPNTYKDLIQLKGVGDYTASAIASFAFGQAHPVIDGNVMRVICRLFGIEGPIDQGQVQKEIRKKIESIFSKQEPDVFNQAIMEFGALHCRPQGPDCSQCPFHTDCVAFLTGKVDELPHKKQSRSKKKRFFHYMVLKADDQYLVRKRRDKDIWQNLYEFPMLEKTSKNGGSPAEEFLSAICEDQVKYSIGKKSDWVKHVLSHQLIHACFQEIELEFFPETLPDEWEKSSFEKLGDYAFPKLIESYISGL